MIRGRMGVVAVLAALLALGGVAVVLAAPECDAKTGICDKDEKCSQWEAQGKCFQQKSVMRQLCPVSCSTRNDDETSSTSSTSTTTETADTTTTATATTTTSSSSQTKTPKSNCTDQHERCHIWARLGECRNNRKDMEQYCSKSCGVCGGSGGTTTTASTSTSTSRSDLPQTAAAAAEEKKDATEVLLDSTLEFGVRQLVNDGGGANQTNRMTFERIRKTIQYLKFIQIARQPSKIRRHCINRNELCSFWAALGECQKNKFFMILHCSAACFSCTFIVEEECAKLKQDKAEERAIPPAILPDGSLDALFERIILVNSNNTTTEAPKNCSTDLGEQVCRTELQPDRMSYYLVQVHSRPASSDKEQEERPLAEDKDDDTDDNFVIRSQQATGKMAAVDHHRPWLISLDDFLTLEECDAMIQKYYHQQQQQNKAAARSTSKEAEDNAASPTVVVCSDDPSCRFEEVPHRIHERISRLLHIPVFHSEHFEFLTVIDEQKQPGQSHPSNSLRHDYDPEQEHFLCGPRIITVIMYLSSGTGGIQFPKLPKGGGGDLNNTNTTTTIHAKQGRIVLWSNVLEEEDSHGNHSLVLTKHPRMEYRHFTNNSSLATATLDPREEPFLVVAYARIHLYDWLTPFQKGCLNNLPK